MPVRLNITIDEDVHERLKPEGFAADQLRVRSHQTLNPISPRRSVSQSAKALSSGLA
jgi:hypothetical protein